MVQEFLCREGECIEGNETVHFPLRVTGALRAMGWVHHQVTVRAMGAPSSDYEGDGCTAK